MAPGSQGEISVLKPKAACRHMSGLLTRHPAAGPDGFRESGPDQALGVAMPHVLG
jgi:hypothetical protein